MPRIRGHLLWALAAAATGCIAPTPIPPPPGAESAAGVLYRAGDLDLLVRPADLPPTFPEGPLTAAVYTRARALDDLASGLVPEPSDRPCPLPEPSERFGRTSADAEWEPIRSSAGLLGWFQGPATATTTLAIDSTCGDGHGDWRATRVGCAVRIETQTPGIERLRAGLGVAANGEPTLELLDVPPSATSCAPTAIAPPAIATSRCERPTGTCFMDVYAPLPSARVERVRLGPPSSTPPQRLVNPPYEFAYTGPALSGSVLWVAVGRSVGVGCAPGAVLRRLDPDSLASVGTSTMADVPVPSLSCVADLIPDRRGGLWVVGRQADVEPVSCPGSPESILTQPWALVHVGADGPERPRPLRLVPDDDVACQTAAWRSEVDADGYVAIGFSRRRRNELGPARSTALVLEVDGGRTTPLVDLTDLSPAGVPLELVGLSSTGTGRWLGLGRGPDQLFVLELGSTGATITLRPNVPAVVPEIPSDQLAPRGFTFIPSIERVVAWTSGAPNADAVYWSPSELGVASLLVLARTSRVPRDILTGLPWARRSGPPTFATLEIAQAPPRTLELVLTELRLEERRVRGLPRRTVLGQGPNHPTVARDARGRLFVTLALGGELVRVEPFDD